MGATATTARLLRGEAGADERLRLARRIERRTTTAMLAAHVLGAFDVAALLLFLLPQPTGEPSAHIGTSLVAFAVYMPLAWMVGHHLGMKLSPARAAWLLEGRDPTPDERAHYLSTPLHCARTCFGLWIGAAVLFGGLHVPEGAAAVLHVSTTIVLGGLTTCAISYLLVERIQRPIHALALASGPPPAPIWPGVEGRLVLAWLSATGVPVLGMVMVACDGLLGRASAEEVGRGVLALGLAALVLGLGVTLIAARTVSSPLTAVRRALARVQAGDLSAEVRVDDGSEVGLLQSGFNQMVGGLRERERVQDLFSRQVGEDVARAALEDEPALGGRVCDVAVLFVDIIGSTQHAQHAPPERVVARLNRFFAIVVDVVGRHGGWVNKFQGDAAMCVFGAPAEQEDAAGCALAAARELRDRLRRELPGVDAGIGLSAGPAVAGWVGAEARFEYSVIGDAVNEAARLCELAKRDERRVLASAAVVDRATGEEPSRWRIDGERVLRGRTAPTRLAAPA